MKSALLAAIFGITGGVAILLAVPAEEKAPVKIHPPKWFPDYGDPVVPQLEEVAPREVLVPEPFDHYFSVAEAKTEKPAARRHMHENVVRPATQQPVTKTVRTMCLVVASGSRIPQPCNRLAAIPTTANPMTIYGHRPGR